MSIREEKIECRMRILLEVIESLGHKPIALGELTRKVNNAMPNNMYKLAPLELSALLKLVKEYKRYTSQQGATEYIFTKWKKKNCRHCGKPCNGQICRECFKRKHTGSVGRARSRRKNER